MEEFSIAVTGFKTKAQAKAFIDWYAGDGEQSSIDWFECRYQEGEIDVKNMMISTETYNSKGNVAQMILDIKAPPLEDEIHNFLHVWCHKTRKKENAGYTELMMDDHKHIIYKKKGYYIPEDNVLYTVRDEEIRDYLFNKYLEQ